jgi:hypothetical protein
LLISTAPLAAVEAPARPPSSALGMIRDLRLTVLARRAFQNDRVLGPLNLGVKVHNGVATVWGPVPSSEVARQAVARIEAINGIYEVRSELQMRRPPEKPLYAELGIPRGAPTRIQVAKPIERPDVANQAQRPTRTTEARSVAQIPQPAAVKPVATTTRPAQMSLSAAVEQVKQSDQRFRGIPVNVFGNVVVVGRSGATDEDVTALAQALRRVRGVAEVVVSSD